MITSYEMFELLDAFKADSFADCRVERPEIRNCKNEVPLCRRYKICVNGPAFLSYYSKFGMGEMVSIVWIFLPVVG